MNLWCKVPFRDTVHIAALFVSSLSLDVVTSRLTEKWTWQISQLLSFKTSCKKHELFSPGRWKFV